MAGKEDMSLYGWKQLIIWSLEHACLSPDEFISMKQTWEKRWDIFLQNVVDDFEGQVGSS